MKLKLFLTFLLVIGLADIYQSIYLRIDNETDYGSSITTFGFSDKRENSLVSTIGPYHKFEKINIPELKGKMITRGQPLYISGDDWSKHSNHVSKGKVVLASRRSLFFVDIETLKVEVKKHSGSKIYNNTGVLDLKKGKIYYANNVGLSVFSFNGKLLDEIELNWETIINKKYPQYSGRGAFCNTALSLYKGNLYWGCSGKNHDEKKMRGAYGEIKGGSGFIAKIFLDKDGHFFNKSPELFFTTKKTNNPMSSYNGGVWLSGGGISFDKESDTLITVAGNGPYMPLERNFGCSAFKLHVKDFSDIHKSDDTDYGYIGSTIKGIQECMFVNYEWASGQVGLARMGSHLIGFVAGKLGRIHAFDTRKMIGDKIFELPYYDVNTNPKPAYGMGNYGSLSIVESGKKASVMHVGLTDQPFYMSISGSEDTFKKIKRLEQVKLGKIKIESKKCLGFALRKKQNDEKEIAFLYSGPYYKHSFLTDSKSKLYKKLTSFGEKPFIYHKKYADLDKFQPKYMHYKNDGYFLNRDSSIPKGFRLKDINEHRWGGHLVLDKYDHDHFLIAKEKASAYYKSSNRNFLLVKKVDEWSCKTNNPNLIPIYKHYLHYDGNTKNLRGWKLNLVDYKNNQFKKRLEYVSQYKNSEPWRTTVSSSLMIHDENKEASLAFVPLRILGDTTRGAIDIINLKKSRKVQRLKLNAPMKFSLPVVVGNKLIIASNSESAYGPLHFFKATISPFGLWLTHSWFRFLW